MGVICQGCDGGNPPMAGWEFSAWGGWGCLGRVGVIRGRIIPAIRHIYSMLSLLTFGLDLLRFCGMHYNIYIYDILLFTIHVHVLQTISRPTYLAIHATVLLSVLYIY